MVFFAALVAFTGKNTGLPGPLATDHVYFKAASFKPQSTVRTWLYTIAANLCRDRLRRLGKHRHDIPLDAPGDDGARTELADPQPIPSERSAQADRFKALQRAIDQLPHRLKLPLVLCTLEGRSQKEAADIMGTTPKAVELRIHHAKVKLRGLLGDLQR